MCDKIKSLLSSQDASGMVKSRISVTLMVTVTSVVQVTFLPLVTNTTFLLSCMGLIKRVHAGLFSHFSETLYFATGIQYFDEIQISFKGATP